MCPDHPRLEPHGRGPATRRPTQGRRSHLRPPLRTPAARAHHDAVVDEALPVPGGLQVRVLLRAGHLDAPDLAPGRVQREVDGVDAGVVRGHRVAAADRDPVLLQDSAGSSVVSGGRTRAARRTGPASGRRVSAAQTRCRGLRVTSL